MPDALGLTAPWKDTDIAAFHRGNGQKPEEVDKVWEKISSRRPTTACAVCSCGCAGSYFGLPIHRRTRAPVSHQSIGLYGNNRPVEAPGGHDAATWTRKNRRTTSWWRRALRLPRRRAVIALQLDGMSLRPRGDATLQRESSVDSREGGCRGHAAASRDRMLAAEREPGTSPPRTCRPRPTIWTRVPMPTRSLRR